MSDTNTLCTATETEWRTEATRDTSPTDLSADCPRVPVCQDQSLPQASSHAATTLPEESCCGTGEHWVNMAATNSSLGTTNATGQESGTASGSIDTAVAATEHLRQLLKRDKAKMHMQLSHDTSRRMKGLPFATVEYLHELWRADTAMSSKSPSSFPGTSLQDLTCVATIYRLRNLLQVGNKGSLGKTRSGAQYISWLYDTADDIARGTLDPSARQSLRILSSAADYTFKEYTRTRKVFQLSQRGRTLLEAPQVKWLLYTWLDFQMSQAAKRGDRRSETMFWEAAATAKTWFPRYQAIPKFSPIARISQLLKDAEEESERIDRRLSDHAIVSSSGYGSSMGRGEMAGTAGQMSSVS